MDSERLSEIEEIHFFFLQVVFYIKFIQKGFETKQL